MKKIFIAVLSVVIAVTGLTACGGEKQTSVGNTANETETEEVKKPEEYTGTVVVYSSHDEEPLNAGVNMFMSEYPNIEVEVVSAGTGELCSRIANEADNPVGDVIWGGGADSLEAFKDYFAPYVCANDEFIGSAYKDPDGLWIGESPLPMVIIYNKESIEGDGLEIPQSWEELTDPKWKGKIAYCLPSESGSAYTQLCTMLFAHGGMDDGWEFIKKFYDNLDGKILDSSDKCHEMVASGDFSVGLTFEKAALQYKDDPNIGFVYPNDGTSAVPDGIALIKGAPNEENAKLFIDFVTSKECQTEQSQNWGRRPVRPDVEIDDALVPLSDLVLVNYDFDSAANDKDDIIQKFNDIMTDTGL